jgi:hypothetical protein
MVNANAGYRDGQGNGWQGNELIPLPYIPLPSAPQLLCGESSLFACCGLSRAGLTELIRGKFSLINR